MYVDIFRWMAPIRNHLTYEQKAKLIKAKDNGSTVDDLAKSFGISRAGVYRILTKRTDILDRIAKGVDPRRKHVNMDEDGQEIEEATFFSSLSSIIISFFTRKTMFWALAGGRFIRFRI